MKNFVLQYRFQLPEARERFKKIVESEFPKLKKVATEEFTYYLIWERHLASLEDKLNEYINQFHAVDKIITNGDYLAIYFIDEAEPDQIKRQMAFGTDDYIDNHIKKGYLPQHETVLNDLLSYDFIKQS